MFWFRHWIKIGCINYRLIKYYNSNSERINKKLNLFSLPLSLKYHLSFTALYFRHCLFCLVWFDFISFWLQNWMNQPNCNKQTNNWAEIRAATTAPFISWIGLINLPLLNACWNSLRQNILSANAFRQIKPIHPANSFFVNIFYVMNYY